MRVLYPSIEPYATHHIPVEHPHTIYVEECGNPNGLPILFVHGGPGMGITEDYRRFFNPDVYRVILFDQRGAGKSTPKGETKNNNTPALIEDIETIRKKFDLERWLIFGGSWGSALSLAYTIHHPERVLGLILRGIFNLKKTEIDWIFNGGGAKAIFPDHFESYQKFIPDELHDDFISAYYNLLTGKDDVARIAAAKTVITWDANCMTLEPPTQDFLDEMLEPSFALSATKIIYHYFKNGCFLGENFIIKNVNKFKHLPGIIVHGRYDLITPLQNAWMLHKNWPSSTLRIINNAGHASLEPGIIDGLVQATDEMAEQFG